jgi:predicted exporter
MVSLLFANESTVIGFGLLAFSSVPLLHAIGLTVATGTVLALAFSAALSR